MSDVLPCKCFGATRAEEQGTGRTAAPGDKPPHPGATGPSLVSPGLAQRTCRPGPGGDGNPGRALSAPGSQCLEPGLRSPVGPQRPLPPGPSTATRPQGRRAGRRWGTACLPGSQQAGRARGASRERDLVPRVQGGQGEGDRSGTSPAGRWAPAVGTPRRAQWPRSKQPLRVALAASQPSRLHPPRGTWGSTADPLLQRGSSRLGRPGPGTRPMLLSQGERSWLGC